MIITPIQTRWNDMDPFAHVNNANYVAYLEIGRVDYCVRRLGVSELYSVPFLLARIEIDLIRPIEFGAGVEVMTCVSKIGNKSWDFLASIRDSNTKEDFARARTVQVAYDHRLKRSQVIPEALRVILHEDWKAYEES